MQVSQQIQQELPGIEIVPSNYPVGQAKAALVNVIGAGQVAGIGLTLFGDRVLPTLGISETHPLLANLQQNKVFACLAFWFVGGTVQQNLMKTGAFEIYYNGKLIYSKLEKGRLPTRDELSTMLINHVPLER